MSQIKVTTSYEKDKKVLNIKLKNETDKAFALAPAYTENPDTTRYSAIGIIYKDKIGNIIYKHNWYIPCWKWDKENKRHRDFNTQKFLFPYETNKYFCDFSKVCKDKNIYKLEIFIQLKAHSIKGKKTYILNTQESFSCK